MGSISAASSLPAGSFLSADMMARLGLFRSVAFISAIGGTPGVPAVSSGAIPSEGCFKDGAAHRCRPIQISNGKIGVAIGISNSSISAQIEL
jgi:hypothetical protein